MHWKRGVNAFETRRERAFKNARSTCVDMDERMCTGTHRSDSIPVRACTDQHEPFYTPQTSA